MRLYFRKCILSSPILAIKWCAKIIYVPTLESESIVLPFDLKSLSPVPANVTDEMSKHEWSGYSGCQLVMKFLQKHFRNFNVYVENKYCWTWDAGWCLAAQMSNIIKWSWIVIKIITKLQACTIVIILTIKYFLFMHNIRFDRREKLCEPQKPTVQKAAI